MESMCYCYSLFLQIYVLLLLIMLFIHVLMELYYEEKLFWCNSDVKKLLSAILYCQNLLWNFISKKMYFLRLMIYIFLKSLITLFRVPFVDFYSTCVMLWVYTYMYVYNLRVHKYMLIYITQMCLLK